MDLNQNTKAHKSFTVKQKQRKFLNQDKKFKQQVINLYEFDMGLPKRSIK